MSMDRIKVEDRAGSVVEPPPKVSLVVRFNGQQKSVTLQTGKSETLDFGNFPIELEVAKVTCKKERPPGGPPYKWKIVTAERTRVIRAMDEENALRLFHQAVGPEVEILEISVIFD